MSSRCSYCGRSPAKVRAAGEPATCWNHHWLPRLELRNDSAVRELEERELEELERAAELELERLAEDTLEE